MCRKNFNSKIKLVKSIREVGWTLRNYEKKTLEATLLPKQFSVGTWENGFVEFQFLSKSPVLPTCKSIQKYDHFTKYIFQFVFSNGLNPKFNINLISTPQIFYVTRSMYNFYGISFKFLDLPIVKIISFLRFPKSWFLALNPFWNANVQ